MQRKISISFAAALLGACLLWTSCGKDPQPENGGNNKPEPGEASYELTVPQVSEITVNSAKVSSTTDLKNISKKGFVYSTKSNPTISSSRQMCEGDAFSLTLEGLSSGTTYYVRAYVLADSKTYYSEQNSFQTESSGDLSDYKAPSYADDYRSIAGWENRASWNLANVHDPTVFLADDGYYYMYQTDASFGNAHDGHGHFHGRRSKNLIDWEYLGGTMTSVPFWVLEKCNEFRAGMGLGKVTEPQFGYWAPSARKVSVNGKTIYRMYYSIVMDNYIGNGKPASTAFDGTWTERAFIGLMETENPADNGSWVDKGYVICSSSDRGLDYSRKSTSDWEGYFRFNAIDPSYIVTPEGKHWLIYGSWHSGIAAVELDPESGKVKAELPNPWGTEAEIAPYGKLIESRGGRWQGSEGPEVIYRDGYYYLFLAYDGLDVPYNTRVVRSANVDGPYVDINGSDATELSQAYPIQTHPYAFADDRGWVGISHCAVFEDGKGNWFYASQARFPNSDTDSWAPNAVMLGHVRKIVWSEDGWPMVLPERYGAVPDLEISADEICGSWEHIDLSYAYAQQRTSQIMTFGEDGKISEGPWSGASWSFDPETRRISVSNGVTLYVERECDWEAKPRKASLVYVAHGNNKTYWGKKAE